MIQSILRTILAVAFLLLLILAVALALSLAGALGIVAVGWVVTRAFSDLSLFEASLIALIAEAGLLLVAYRFLTIAFNPVVKVGEEEEEEEEEEFEPPIVPWRRSRPTHKAHPGTDRTERQRSRRQQP